jgi:hypothetical protein
MVHKSPLRRETEELNWGYGVQHQTTIFRCKVGEQKFSEKREELVSLLAKPP